MRFLSTQSGLIRAGAIDQISALHERSKSHEIHFHIGDEARLTRASAEAVEQFLNEVA
jgi:hypothetical protein